MEKRVYIGIDQSTQGNESAVLMGGTFTRRTDHHGTGRLSMARDGVP